MNDSYDENKLNIKEIEKLYIEGVAYFKLGKYKEAIENFDKILNENLKDLKKEDVTNSYYNRGLAKESLGQHEEAIKDFDQAINLDSNNIDAYYNRGIIKSEFGQYEEAIEDFYELIKLNPEKLKKAGTYYNIGLSKNKLSNSNEAIKNLNKKEIENFKKEAIKNLNEAIKLNLNYTDAYLAIGIVKYELGQHEEAIEDFNKVIELDPENKNGNNAKAYFFIGFYSIELAKLNEAIENLNEEAIENLNEAIKLDSNYIDAYFVRGIAKSGSSEYQHKDVIEDFIKSFEISAKKKKENFNEEVIYYRFRPINKNVIKELVLQIFFVANPKDFNDPYDCHIIEQLEHEWGLIENPLLDMFKRFRIASFSCDYKSKKTYKNILVWSHYADSHKGICIGYKFKEGFFEKHKKSFVAKVNYKETIEYDPTKPLWESDLLLKYEDWQYENEHRLIYLSDEDNSEPLLLPMEDGIEIAEIIFGRDSEESERKMIYELFDKKTREEIDFYTAVKNPDNKNLFDLVIKDYSPKKKE